MKKTMRIALATALFAAATPADANEGVSQTVGHGQIDWSNKTITATGSGAPDLKAANVAVARLGAERAAKMDALRNIIEAVRGVRVSGEQSAGERMDADSQLKARVQGIVKGFKVVDTKYYSDGGVDVIVQVPMDGVLTEALLSKEAGKKAGDSSAATEGSTGVIINAKGIEVVPALAPTIFDEKGAPVYSAAHVKQDAVQSHGVVSYSQSIDAAMKDARVSDKPVIIRAKKLSKKGGSDLVISAADAEKLKKLGSVLADGKVIIVTD